MDWRNDESDHSSVENFTWDEKNVTRIKSDTSLSGTGGYNMCSQGVQANFDVCKECLERLGLETPIEVSNPFRPTSKITQTEPSDDIDQELYSVNATDLFPCRQTFLHQPDILYFQGVKYPPEDIARHWKKDSRTWLWKSVRRRRNKSVSTNETCETNTENIENE